MNQIEFSEQALERLNEIIQEIEEGEEILEDIDKASYFECSANELASWCYSNIQSKVKKTEKTNEDNTQK